MVIIMMITIMIKIIRIVMIIIINIQIKIINFLLFNIQLTNSPPKNFFISISNKVKKKKNP